MDLSLQKRLAAEILGVGESRIWINPEEAERVSEAITREDIRKLIKEGVIRVKPEHSNSRGRWRRLHKQRKKGRRRGPGSRKGKATARLSKKEAWMNRVRAQRKLLKTLRDKGVISRKDYRRLYRLVKGGVFKSVAQLRTYIKEHILQR